MKAKQMPEPTIKQRMETLKLAADAMRLAEALRIATNALALYAKPATWGEDDWGIKAVNKAEYGRSQVHARLPEQRSAGQRHRRLG